MTTKKKKKKKKSWSSKFQKNTWVLKNKSPYGKMNTIVDGESKRTNLDGESTTPQSQIVRNSRIGYSIDGKRLRKPEFGYSIDGEKLSELPPIEKILDIIGVCGKPFEKKLLKYEFDRISFHREDVRTGFHRSLTEDEAREVSKEGILVNTYDELGNRYEMKFKSYKNSVYKLCDGWEKLYNDLKLNKDEDCYVDVWMFRHKENKGVCFAVILRR